MVFHNLHVLRGKRRAAIAALCLVAILGIVSAGTLGQTCSACASNPSGLTKTIYVGSDPSQTFLEGTNTTATAVIGKILQSWTTLSSATQCQAKWVWKNYMGVPTSPNDQQTFVNHFIIPAGYKVASACMEISADDTATIQLNGEKIGSHADTNGKPNGGPSGWDEVSVINVQSSELALFHTGDNDLKVTAKDVHGAYVGAIWCLRICLTRESIGYGCSECPSTATDVLYVSSGEPGTKIASSNAPATEVLNPLVLNAWCTLPPNPASPAAWVWRNTSGNTKYKESITFVNSFNIPTGSTVVSACLEIAADDKASVSLNGVNVATHSGHDAFSVHNIKPSYFVAASNELRVNVKDVGGNYAGGIWRLKICLASQAVQGCRDCQPGTTKILVGSNPNQTYVDSTSTKAIPVTGTILTYWTGISNYASCKAAWVWTDDDGSVPGLPHETFINHFSIPAGYSVSTACIEINADDKATVYLNGQQVGIHMGNGGTQPGIMQVPPSMFHSGANELAVTVQNLQGQYAGGIWCMQVCLKKMEQTGCSCGNIQAIVKPDVGIGGTTPPGTTIFYAEPGSTVTVTLTNACDPLDCVKQLNWKLKDQKAGMIIDQGPFNYSGGTCQAQFTMPDNIVEFSLADPTYQCGSATCESTIGFLISPCQCGHWTEGAVVSDAAKAEIPSNWGFLGTFVQLPQQAGPISVYTRYICGTGCPGGSAAPSKPEVYLWTVSDPYSGNIIASGQSTVGGHSYPILTFPASGASPLVVEIIPICEGHECEIGLIQIGFTPSYK